MTREEKIKVWEKLYRVACRPIQLEQKFEVIDAMSKSQKDLIQDCYTAALEDIDMWEPRRGPLWFFIYNRAKWKSWDDYRNSKRYEEVLAKVKEQMLGEQEIYPYIDHDVESNFVKTLTPDFWVDLLDLHFNKGYTQQELAPIMGVSQATVSRILKKKATRVKDGYSI